jgi:hypothetical protein
MVSKSRTIDLVSKLNPDVFRVINKDIFGTVEQPLGSCQGAVNRVLAPEYDELLKSIMPNVISINPNDPSWYKKIKYYWDSFGIKVPIGGTTLEIGFNFDINSTTRKVAIKELIANAKDKKVDISTEEELANYVLKNINEFDKHKYATPINPTHYLTWLFCLGHRKVAKQTDSVNKSTNIEFVLIDPKEIESTKKLQHTLSVEATKKYLEIIADRAKVKDILYIKQINVSSLDDFDMDIRLKHIADSEPKEFLAIANDPAMTTKARIERYCISGILRKLPNSSIIVDANDNSVIVGNSVDEAVVYFASEAPDRAAKVKEFKTRYAQLNKVN